MQQEFWYARWEQNQIGFHLAEVNPHLLNFWPTLELAPHSRVLLPLCGKSIDMLWLLAQGFQVVGVELSPLAVAAFFQENQLEATTRQVGGFQVTETQGLQIYCGDFFKLTTQELGQVDALYDRAALVALPPAMRVDYVAHLQQFLSPKQQSLLVAFNYQQAEMAGPPFSVPDEEIVNLYADWCDIELLATADILQQEAHFKARGLSSLLEVVYRLTVR